VNKIPGVNEVLALLDQLKALIQDFAAREEKLETEFRSRSSTELRAFQRASEEETRAQAERVQNQEADSENRLQRARAAFDGRKSGSTRRTKRCGAPLAMRLPSSRAVENTNCSKAPSKPNAAAMPISPRIPPRSKSSRTSSTIRATRICSGSTNPPAPPSAASARSAAVGARSQMAGAGSFGDHHKLYAQVERLREKIDAGLRSFRKLFLPHSSAGSRFGC